MVGNYKGMFSTSWMSPIETYEAQVEGALLIGRLQPDSLDEDDPVEAKR